MEYIENNECYFFSTGKMLYANCGIIGLSPNSEGVVDYGYDGEFCHKDELSDAELKELSEYMINLWTEFSKR